MNCPKASLSLYPEKSDLRWYDSYWQMMIANSFEIALSAPADAVICAKMRCVEAPWGVRDGIPLTLDEWWNTYQDPTRSSEIYQGPEETMTWPFLRVRSR